MTDQIDKAKAKAFEDEYLALCQKHGLLLTFVPQWRQSQDTGTFSLIIQAVIAQMPKQAD